MSEGVLQFFQSLGRAFAPKVELARDVELGLAALVAVLLLLFFSRPLRERLRRGRRFRRQLREQGLSAGERRQVEALAREAGVEPLAVLERRDEFERATAQALHRHTTGDAPPLIHRLRHLLSFDRVPAGAPLYSSRELAPGALLLVGDLPARVTAVTEEVLAVALNREPGLAPGATATAALSRGHDARYRLRCLVRAVERSAPDGWIAFLEHDEAPERVQARAAVRVALHGGVGLAPLAPPGGAESGGQPALLGELLDLSVGGALVSLHAPVERGQRFALAFGAGRVRFEGLRAEVLRTEEGPGGTCRAHLSFRGLGPAEQERLAAAVTRLDLQEQQERRLGPEG